LILRQLPPYTIATCTAVDERGMLCGSPLAEAIRLPMTGQGGLLLRGLGQVSDFFWTI